MTRVMFQETQPLRLRSWQLLVRTSPLLSRTCPFRNRKQEFVYMHCSFAWNFADDVFFQCAESIEANIQSSLTKGKDFFINLTSLVLKFFDFLRKTIQFLRYRSLCHKYHSFKPTILLLLASIKLNICSSNFFLELCQ